MCLTGKFDTISCRVADPDPGFKIRSDPDPGCFRGSDPDPHPLVHIITYPDPQP